MEKTKENTCAHLIIKYGLDIEIFEQFVLYEEFLKLSEPQRKQILKLIELEKDIRERGLRLEYWKGRERIAKSLEKDCTSAYYYVFSDSYPHISDHGPSFGNQEKQKKCTVIERADIISGGVQAALIIAEENEKLERKTKKFERKYPGMFFPWQEIPNNDLVRRLKNVEKYDEDLDKVYNLQELKIEAPLEKLHYLEAECSNRIANIRACIKTKDFEEGKGLNYYVKELIMFYQARQAARNEIEVYELFRVLGENSSEITYQD